MLRIKNHPLFSDIDENIIMSLINENKIYKTIYSKGVTVYEKGTLCSGIDIVISGKLIAYALAANGSETIVFEFTKNSLIGANLLFGEENTYPMNIYSTRECEIIHINKESVVKLLREYEFTLAFIKYLSLNSQGLNKKIAIYTQKSLRENIIDYLQVLSLEQNSRIIILPMTKKELADYFGVQRPSLFREFKKLKDEGLIEVDNRKIELKSNLNFD